MYSLFLRLMSQLAGSGQALIPFQDKEILVEKGTKKSSQWKISTKIFTLDEEMPKSVKEYISSFRTLKWQERGAYLKVDLETSSIFLVQEIAPLVQYLCFRSLITDFVDIADEWKEILEETLFAQRRT